MTDPSPAHPGLTPTRRQVVRSIAWSAPLVTIAVTAPAYAASVRATLRFDTFNLFPAVWSGSRPTMLESQVQVQHRWAAGSPTVTSLVLTVLLPANRVSGAAATIVSGSGWAATGVVASGSAWAYSFVYAPALAPGSSTHPLDLRVPLASNSAGKVTANATASAPRASAVSAVATSTLH